LISFSIFSRVSDMVFTSAQGGQDPRERSWNIERGGLLR
jgi:hypothetical protein